MKKNIIILISCVALLLAVGGVYMALMMNDGDKDTDSSNKSEESGFDSSSGADESDEIYVPVALLKFESTDIKSVSVKNSEGEFVGVPDGEPDEDGTVTFTIEGLEKLELNSNTQTLLNSASALNSEATAEEEPSDIDKYGLTSPAAEVIVKAGSGEKTLLVGDESPIKGQTYCMEKGGNAVYLVSNSSVSVFLNDKESFVSTTVLENPGEENTPKIDSIKIERTDIDYDILFEYDNSSEDGDTNSGSLATHYMTEPVFAYLNAEKATDALKGFFGMSADSVIKAYPSDEDIAAVGLDEPFCTVTMKTDEPCERVLKVGKKISGDGNYYPVMIDDKQIIYSVPETNVCWAGLNPGDIISRLVFGINVWNIGKMEITANGVDKAVFEGSGSSADDYVVTKNGKPCDTERFRNLYKFLLKTSAEDLMIGEQKPDEEPIASVYVETQSGKTKQKVEFYPANGKMAMIVVNDKSFFKCRMAYVDLLIDNLKKFDGTEEFVMNW